MVTELAGAEGKAAGLAAAQKAAEEEIGKQDLTGMEFVAFYFVLIIIGRFSLKASRDTGK